jgi:hypothetical protein
MLRATFCFLVFAIGCTSPDLKPVDDRDVLRLQLETENQGRDFRLTLLSSGGYGCNAEIAVRSGRNAQLIFLDVLGIMADGAGCPGVVAQSRAERFANITNSRMVLEIWHRGTKDRYEIEKGGNGVWTLSYGTATFSRLNITAR